MTEADASDPATHDAHDEDQPRGTFVLMLLFILLIAAMFAWMYITLLERS